MNPDRVIWGNGRDIFENFITVCGSKNRIYGKGVLVLHDDNQVFGDCPIVLGNNEVYGRKPHRLRPMNLQSPDTVKAFLALPWVKKLREAPRKSSKRVLNLLHKTSSERRPSLAEPCLICLDKPKNVLLYPCGHSVLCQTCAARYYSRKRPCLCCRKPVKRVVPIYA